jgi:hypothetical protein
MSNSSGIDCSFYIFEDMYEYNNAQIERAMERNNFVQAIKEIQNAFETEQSEHQESK